LAAVPLRALDFAAVRPYVKGVPELAMSDTVVAAARRSIPTLIVAGIVGLVMAGTAALWAHYGTAVFFEMIRAGFVACFG
jgi:hypothetical protein